MPGTSYVKEWIWTDEWFRSLPDNELRYFFLYLITFGPKQWNGITSLDIDKASMELNLPTGKVMAALGAVTSDHLNGAAIKPRVLYDERTGEVWIRKYLHHQTGGKGLSPKQRSGMKKMLNNVESRWLLREFFDEYENLADLNDYDFSGVTSPTSPPAVALPLEEFPVPGPQPPHQPPSPPPAEPILTNPTPKKPAPFNLDSRIEAMKQSPIKNQRIIGHYLRYTRPDNLKSAEQFRVYTGLHEAAARRLEAWPEDSIYATMEWLQRKSTDDKWENQWTLNTVAKFVSDMSATKTKEEPVNKPPKHVPERPWTEEDYKRFSARMDRNFRSLAGDSSVQEEYKVRLDDFAAKDEEIRKKAAATRGKNYQKRAPMSLDEKETMVKDFLDGKYGKGIQNLWQRVRSNEADKSEFIKIMRDVDKKAGEVPKAAPQEPPPPAASSSLDSDLDPADPFSSDEDPPWPTDDDLMAPDKEHP